MMKPSALLLCLAAALSLLPASVRADGNYYNVDLPPKPAPASSVVAEDPQPSLSTALPVLSDKQEPLHTAVVTSLGKCYAQIGHAEALEIQRNFVKPYAECERRLALKQQKEQQAKAGDMPKPKGDRPQTRAESDPDPLPPAADPVPHGFYKVQKKPLQVDKPPSSTVITPAGNP